MALFPQSFYNTDASFTPLFRLLDDFDKYSRSGSSGNISGGRASRISHWQPKFDVRETSAAYHLHGELPGLTKEQVSIEFPEPQSLVIRGKTERTYTGNSPTGLLESAGIPAAITEAGESPKSQQATVEDENATDSTPKDEPAAPADKAKYWITERSIGEFSRHFNFPARIDRDAVTASLSDGILTIDVPKAKKPETRRIAIN
ncbi:unnamed protein product [Clonostachys rosea f. rosea IK726]|jgi:HSP20 family molecular chaperone IbpA|uniref:SHSP domain-containing protein n=3 Tax=Bionectria ochroleuca TaxID=29856 RepID=A0A0B7JQL5_BIOOC|nr:unnamed protein product [Clonostachys rosea f. rosea IK726]CAG9950473.1 unnamed protein product [Clonostachys rosea f. rosea IK726]